MAEHQGNVDRESVIARVLRPLGTKPLTQEQAKQAAKLLNVHWTTVYRLRRRFLADPVASAVRPRARGPKVGKRRLGSPPGVLSDHCSSPPVVDSRTLVRRRGLGVTPIWITNNAAKTAADSAITQNEAPSTPESR